MKITVSASANPASAADLAVFFISENERKKKVSTVVAADEALARARRLGDFSGRTGDSLTVYNPDGKPARVMFVGCGKETLDSEGVRKLVGSMVGRALKQKATRLVIAQPPVNDLPVDTLAEAICEGAILAAYRFDRYRKDDPDEPVNEIKEIVLSFPADTAAARRGVTRGRIKAEAACLARDLANEPGNVLTPEQLAETARGLARDGRLTCRVLDEKDMRKKAMGGLLGVNQGSGKPPRLIILEYRQGKKKRPLLLVGKGLTFDSGGISLKPGAGMEDMKFDMCGGAGVIAVMGAISALAPKNRHVVALVPATENLPGPDALKPGDIIRICDGTTVEVVNTDAEGRLILADALAYGIKKFKPAAVIDMATLTGAAIIGLGHHRSALLSNDDRLAADLAGAADFCGEPLWRLPLGEEYAKQLKSTVADLKNVGGRPAGTITAACFLEKFVGDTPWAHIDIAGTAWDFTEKSYVPRKGPSGVAVRTLIEFIRNWKG